MKSRRVVIVPPDGLTWLAQQRFSSIRQIRSCINFVVLRGPAGAERTCNCPLEPARSPHGGQRFLRGLFALQASPLRCVRDSRLSCPEDAKIAVSLRADPAGELRRQTVSGSWLGL